MRVPRRTPFYAPAGEELAYVRALLYDAGDVSAQQNGVRITRLWMNRAACPQAVEVTALLVQARLMDRIAGVHEGTRAAYAMGIVRFVNSVVDVFQTGMYAQSIGAIADRIGLPQWLVQVRHSATHEELPSMLVCREACALSLQWLDQHYWQPTLAPPTADAALDADDAPRRDAAAAAAHLLHVYRAHAHALARDRSLALRSEPPVVKSVADLEQWVQAETARRIAHASEHGTPLLAGGASHGGVRGMHDEALTSTASVLMLLITQLLLPGALVPAAKDRTLSQRADVAVEALAADHTAVWDPLLRALHAAFPVFLPLLVQALAHVAQGGASAKAATYAAAARAWLAHLSLDAPYAAMEVTLDAPRWRNAPSATRLFAAPEEADAVPLAVETQQEAPLRRLVVQHAMEVGAPATLALADALADDALRPCVAALHAVRRAAPASDPSPLHVLEMRSRWLRGLGAAPTPPCAPPPDAPPTDALPGWTRPVSWAPTPIGCLAGQRAPLLVPDVPL